MCFVVPIVGESMFSSSEMGEGRARRRKKASVEEEYSAVWVLMRG